MQKIEKIHILGMGGIGCAYASKFYEAGIKINVIADAQRIEKYRENGFIVNGKKYDFEYVNPEENNDKAQLIIVGVKYYQLNSAIEQMKSFVGPNTIIISLLNGITSEEIIGSKLGMDKMLYAMCFGIDAVREDNRINFTGVGVIEFGDGKKGENSEKVLAVADVFKRAELEHIVSKNILRSLWWKFMLNTGINQASAVLGGNYSIFQHVEEARVLMNALMKEVIVLSQQTGIFLNEKDIENWYKVLDGLGPQNKTSMLQDVEAGRKTEVDMFSGVVCELGKKYGVNTPVNETIFNVIKAMEKIKEIERGGNN